jgi:hypothetical protein
MSSLNLDRAVETFARATDGTVGLEEEFALLHPSTLDLVNRTRCCTRASPAS